MNEYYNIIEYQEKQRQLKYLQKQEEIFYNKIINNINTIIL